MNHGDERTVEFALIERIATALRDELGIDKEDQPALHDPDQAGQLNRGFRIVAREILRASVQPDEDLADGLTWVLNRLVHLRLDAARMGERQAAFLLRLQPATRDDWTAFLILTTDDELRHILSEQGPPSGPS
jgi:hypothetical protein